MLIGVVFAGALLALGTGLLSPGGRAAGPITLTVPGAMNLAVHCGDSDTTHFADGEEIRFEPDGELCDIEAPLSPVMPVRGQLAIGRGSRYTCDRHAMELICRSI